MNMEQIQYLSAINQHHSIRRASEHLHLTPQALSQSISALEDSLSLSLVGTSHKGTYLTHEGHVVLEAGNAFLQTLDELRSAAPPVHYKYLPTARLDLLATDGLSNTLLPKLIAQLYMDFPNIEISVNDQSSWSRILGQLSKDDPHELAFISMYKYQYGYLPDFANHPGLAFQPLSQSKYCCCIPKNHEIYHYNSISVSTALKYPILITKKGESLQRQVLESYAKPKKVIAVPNFSVYHQLLENSPYLSFSRLSSSLEFSIESVSRKAIPFKEDIRVYFGYIYRTDRELSPLMQEFLDYTLIYCKHHYGD